MLHIFTIDMVQYYPQTLEPSTPSSSADIQNAVHNRLHSKVFHTLYFFFFSDCLKLLHWSSSTHVSSLGNQRSFFRVKLWWLTLVWIFSQLNFHFQGYSDTVVNELVKSARSTSAEQLRNLLYLMLDNNNVRRKESLAQARIVLNLLNKPCSALLRALEFVPPLPYSLPKTEMCSAKYCWSIFRLSC